MPDLPRTPKAFAKRWPAFKGWLQARGSEVRTPTNQYELARFTTPEGVGVVYRNGREVISAWKGGADDAFSAFLDAKPWRVGVKTKTPGKSKRDRRINDIMDRDGNACCYCGGLFAPRGEFASPGKKMTIEHFVPRTNGGPDNLANSALAHQDCNNRAGNLSVAEKMRLRDEMREG
ncbi:HNH endonuclease [Pelagibius litoralis]|uniref:HNH endonuclease n=1 Tax=Pelagibius litoralis TaxID=374515 RepID=A0A967F089_9PROT|nr:HNH endonuclease [Pelagibius litoralis]NIA70743.1 HNH endonuclease [Pelagibius litoralis]